MMNTTANRSTIIASAMGYTITLTDDRISISRESGEWAGDGRWEDGCIVDCPAHLADDPDESERVYDALETALGDEVDEAEAAPRQVRIPITTQAMRDAVAESAHPDSDPDDYEAAYRGALEWIGERANIEIDTPADGPADDSDLAQEVWQLAHDMMWWDGSAWQWDDDRAHAHDRADRIRNQ